MKLFGDNDHIGRRIMHSMSSVIALAYVIGLLEWWEITVLTGIGAGVITALEFDRVVLGNSVLDPLYREYEKDSPAGYAYAIVGMFLAVLVFGYLLGQPDVAVVSVLVLAFADPVAGIFSPNRLMKVKPARILALMFALSFAIALAADPLFPALPEAALGDLGAQYMPNPYPDVQVTWLEALGVAIGATVGDGVKYRVKGHVVDDNLTIPVYAGTLMYVFGLAPL
ncbi:MAG: hypothetical protein ACOCT0_03990 [Halobacteriota archaeon]